MAEKSQTPWTGSFSAIVRVKKSWDWKYIDFACMQDIKMEYLLENQEELVTGCSVNTFSDRAGSLIAKLYAVLNKDAQKLFLDASVVVTPSGALAVDEDFKVPLDSSIELSERSSDDAGVTGIVVKDSAGVVVIEAGNYSIATVNNKTVVTILAGAIAVGDTINITWTVNVHETNTSDISFGTSMDTPLDVMLEWGKTINGVFYPFTMEVGAWSVTSGYVMAFLNEIKWWVPQWTELWFKFAKWWAKINDTVEPAEAAIA